MLTDPEDGRTEHERAAALSVNRVTLYRWRQDPDFAARLAEQREAITRAWRTPVRAALIRAALAGDVAAIRLFETLVGEVTERTERSDPFAAFEDHELQALVQSARVYLSRAGARIQIGPSDVSSDHL